MNVREPVTFFSTQKSYWTSARQKIQQLHKSTSHFFKISSSFCSSFLRETRSQSFFAFLSTDRSTFFSKSRTPLNWLSSLAQSRFTFFTFFNLAQSSSQGKLSSSATKHNSCPRPSPLYLLQHRNTTCAALGPDLKIHLEFWNSIWNFQGFSHVFDWNSRWKKTPDKLQINSR